MPAGALAGGALAAWTGNRAALWMLCAANLVPAAWRLLSPRLHVRDLPEQPSRQPGDAGARQPAP
jgi:hypothetical protein